MPTPLPVPALPRSNLKWIRCLEEINGILSELGVDETAENILKDEEFADVFMYAEITPDSAEEYWRATLDNSEVVADVQLGFVVGDRIEGP